jgi:tetratricopeptide (TPR) repeat protein
MRLSLLSVLLCSALVPAALQAQTPASAPTQEQVAAFNRAVTDFTAAQKAQQAGDNAGAAAKYDAALPAIREMVRTQPDNADNNAFLANALYAAAAANGALQKIDMMVAMFEESAPLWRKVVAAKPDDAQSATIFGGILVQLGNARLAKSDKAGAAPLYAEALPLARNLAGKQSDAPTKNLLLSALIGASQANEDKALGAEAATLSKAMLADGSVDAANKPAAEILSQSAQSADH